MDDKRTGQQIKLRNGRKLGYAEYGSPEGTAVFYFHGFPSSRLDWQLFNDNDMLTEVNARIIAPDRPGYGLSDFKRHRKITDWSEDVLALADALKIESFTVLGISGGGPYAAACAFSLWERLIKVGIVCGMGPSNAPGMADGVSWSLPGAPPIIRRVILMLTSLGLRRGPDQFIAKTKEVISELDGQLLDKPELVNLFIEGMREAFRQGISGANLDAALYARPWGFELKDIAAEVNLWHGEQDKNVPISVGRYVADAIPNCRAAFLEDEGHFTLPYFHMREILGVLVG
jgi:pimeloyl-ACP methyl ester carboxylesterase